MLIPVTILEWRGKGRRVSDINGESYLLNSNRMYEIKDCSVGSRMIYFDDITNPRDGGALLICTSTVDEIKTACDLTAISSTIQLSVFRDNDIAKPIKSYGVLIDNISYARTYRDTGYSYVVISNERRSLSSVICNITTSDIMDLVSSPISVNDLFNEDGSALLNEDGTPLENET